jgi:hypothetical protein
MMRRETDTMQLGQAGQRLDVPWFAVVRRRGWRKGMKDNMEARPRDLASGKRIQYRGHTGGKPVAWGVIATKKPHRGRAEAARSSSTTKKPELDSGLSATFYTENNFKSSLDAAPQICACQPHTV